MPKSSLRLTHVKKVPVIPSLKNIRRVTREKQLFQTRVRCFQLTLARNSSFSPLVAQCTNFIIEIEIEQVYTKR